MFDPTSPQAQSLVSAMGYVSLALIFLAFGLIATLSMRSRTISSFQFELYIFILVIVLAEVPGILISLGWLQNLEIYALTGLELHSISMAFLSAFVLWRAYRAFGGRKPKLASAKVQPEPVEPAIPNKEIGK
jgi:hypothetical protein